MSTLGSASSAEQASDSAEEPPPEGACTMVAVEDSAATIHLSPPLRRRLKVPVCFFRRRFYPDVPNQLWNDWKWQMRNRVRTVEQLKAMLQLTLEEEAWFTNQKEGTYPAGITPYYLSLISAGDPSHPLRRSVVPTVYEFVRSPGEADDPLGEDGHSPVPGLVHRYPDRVLFLVHDSCSTYCRYCTRSRVVGHGCLTASEERWKKMIDYIAATPVVRDVLLSGGDPLLLDDDRIEWLLSSLRAIPHLEILRIGTKTPAVLPQRITPSLVRMLRRYHPLWMNLHFTHPEECTPDAYRACAALADAGIPLGSQTVLLKGINDSVEVMRKLMQQMVRMRVRPYYLYQCDPISGSAHFRTPVETGIEMIKGLRGHTTGFAVPQYVIDAPGGGGKIPLLPDYVVGRLDGNLVLRNWEERVFTYPDAGCVAPVLR